jgi:hypothetical protein
VECGVTAVIARGVGETVIARREAPKQSRTGQPPRWIASLSLAMTGETVIARGVETPVIARREAPKQSRTGQPLRWIASLSLAMTAALAQWNPPVIARRVGTHRHCEAGATRSVALGSLLQAFGLFNANSRQAV